MNTIHAVLFVVYGVLLGISGTLLVLAQLELRAAKRRAAEIRDITTS